MILIRVVKLFLFFFIVVTVSILSLTKPWASYLCQKQWKCQQYQKQKLGPNYTFSFVKPTIVKDDDIKNNDLSRSYINSLVKIINLSNKNFSGSFWATGKAIRNFSHSNFEKAVMRGFFAKDITIKNVNFKNADLFGAIFVGVSFKDVNLENVDLRYSDLGFSEFINVDLRGANLTNSNLIGTKFIKVLINKKTKFPIGFNFDRLKP